MARPLLFVVLASVLLFVTEAQSSNSTSTNYKNASNFLANERTYLAWIRTALAMMSIGFGAAKLSGSSVSAIVLSIFALSSGGLLGGFATWRYFEVIDELQAAKFSPDKYGPVLMSLFLAVSAVAFTLWIVWDNAKLCALPVQRSAVAASNKRVSLRKSFREEEAGEAGYVVEGNPTNGMLHQLIKPQRGAGA